MIITKENVQKESKKAERYIEVRFFISLAIPTIVTLALLSSSLTFPIILELFGSFPLILTILFTYFALIPKWLSMPPFLSSEMCRHETALSIVGLTLLSVTLVDFGSAFGVSLSIQNILTTFGLPMSSFLVSNLTYFMTLTLGALAYLIRKSRQRVEVDLAWFAKMLPLKRYKPVAYLPPPRMMEKGFPVLVRNRTNKTLVITNIRLKTIMGSPVFVPYSVTKAFLSDSRILSYTVNADEKLDMPWKVEPKKADLIYIPWKVFDRAARELSEKVDFSETVAMSYIRLYDEFAGKNWDTRTFHVTLLLFMGKLPDILQKGNK